MLSRDIVLGDRSEWQIEAGLRSASQLERICHPSLWAAVANRIQRAGGPPISTQAIGSSGSIKDVSRECTAT
jgi:hypothetical protein